MTSLWKGAVLLSGALLFVMGCSKPVVRCPSPEDNPLHHYLSGMVLLEEGRLDEAASKFERASFCDEKFGPAHAGAALTAALKAKDVADPDHRKIDVERARARLKTAWRSSKGPEDEFAWRMASMRAETALKEGDWLDEVEDGFTAAKRLRTDEEKLLYYRTPEAADYFMGAAFLEAREFQKARESFGAVLNARSSGKWHSSADNGWKRADKIVRALSGVTLGNSGRQIAVQEKVTRADMAALLVDELKVDRLFAGRIPVKPKDEGYIPADVLSSQFKEEVASLVKWSVRGLEPSYDSGTRAYLFRPHEPVKRKELAMALEDVLIKITGDEGIAAAFLGHKASPFPDVQPTSPWYNAAMSMVTRNIMEAGLSGEFRPDEVVDGAEAVMAIRALKYRLELN